MAELNEQRHIEDDTLEMEDGDEPPPVRQCPAPALYHTL